MTLAKSIQKHPKAKSFQAMAVAFALPTTLPHLPTPRAPLARPPHSAHQRPGLNLSAPLAAACAARAARRASEKTDGQGSEALSNRIRGLFGSLYTLLSLPFGGLGNFAKVEQGSVGVVLRFGRFERLLQPGRHPFNVAVERVIVVPLRLAQRSSTGFNLRLHMRS